MNRNKIFNWLREQQKDPRLNPQKEALFIAKIDPNGKYTITANNLLFDDPDQIEKYLDQQGYLDYTLIIDNIPRPE